MKTIANSEFFRTVFEQQREGFEKCHHGKVKLKAQIKSSFSKECYRLHPSSRECGLEGDSGAALLQGLSLLDVALKSGHLREYAGQQEARYPYRWLFLDEIPQALSEEQLCLRILQLGYNGVIVRSMPKNREVFKLLGVKVALAASSPGICPFDPDWNPTIELNRSLDGIYWKGTYHQPHYLSHPRAKDALQIDLAIQEVKALESFLAEDNLLIYEIDSSTSPRWIPELMDEMGSKTLLCFSSFFGSPAAMHGDPNPLWDLLRQLPDTSSTQLLPIINMGNVNQGDGLWPTVPIGLLEFVLSRMRRHSFGGAVIMTRYLSEAGTFLDGSLWSAGHSLWGQHPPSLLLESWCKAYHPCLSSLELLRDLANVSRRLSELGDIKKCSTEECRLISEGIVGEINRLQRLVDRCQEARTPSIQDYFTFFARDARRKVLYFLQQHHAPMVNVLNGDDLSESFWTVIQQSGGMGLTHHAKVSLLESPQKGEAGSIMRQIYHEVTKKT